MVQFCYLLHFSQRCELSSWKAAFTIEFFAAIKYNYNNKQWAYEPQKHTKQIEINQSQTNALLNPLSSVCLDIG